MFWVVTEIVNESNLVKRMKIMKHFIKIASKFCFSFFEWKEHSKCLNKVWRLSFGITILKEKHTWLFMEKGHTLSQSVEKPKPGADPGFLDREFNFAKRGSIWSIFRASRFFGFLRYLCIPDTLHEYTRFLSFSEHCRDCKNFNSMFAIVSGLNHSSVSRLHNTWEKLPNKYRKMYEVSEKEKLVSLYEVSEKEKLVSLGATYFFFM